MSDVADLAQERVESIIARAKEYGENTRVVIDKMEHEDVFPFPAYAVGQKKPDWADSNVGMIEMNYPRHGHWLGEQTVFRVGTERVPDWMLGFTSFDQSTCLPDDGTIDDIKTAILQCLADSVMLKARGISALFARYNIETVEFIADFLTGELSVYCHTQRGVMSVNGIMSNHRVRKAMTGKVTVHVEALVENERRTDTYLGRKQPKYQPVVRMFIYRDKVLVHNEPDHWSAGTKYERGDNLNIGGMQWVVGVESADPGRGWDDRRRFKDCAALSARERAYSQAARNR